MRAQVIRCLAAACAYNLHDGCHAVNVEMGKEAGCDLFTRSVMFTVNPRFHSQISHCGASGCEHNRLAGCTKHEIDVGGTECGKVSGACCLSFEPRHAKKNPRTSR